MLIDISRLKDLIWRDTNWQIIKANKTFEESNMDGKGGGGTRREREGEGGMETDAGREAGRGGRERERTFMSFYVIFMLKLNVILCHTYVEILCHLCQLMSFYVILCRNTKPFKTRHLVILRHFMSPCFVSFYAILCRILCHGMSCYVIFMSTFYVIFMSFLCPNFMSDLLLGHKSSWTQHVVDLVNWEAHL